MPDYHKILRMAVSIVPVGFCMGTVFPRAFEMSDQDAVFKLLASDTLGSALGFFLFYTLIIVFGLTLPVAAAIVLYSTGMIAIRVRLR